MDPCDGSRRARHPDRSNDHHHHHPSFSSTLLDAIYRSIDGDSPPDHPMVIYADAAARAKQGDPTAGFRRDFLIEKWVAAEEEKKTKKMGGSDEREAGHRGSRVGDWNRSMVLTNSSSSSSDSSSRSGGGFSSSESESRARYSASCYSVRRPKPKPAPIRTSVSDRAASAFDRGHVEPRKSHHHAPQSQRPSSNKHEGLGFVKTKSKALKIYGDLKKANNKLKQPISPGARLASFLNSIFTVGSPKKAKIVTSSVEGDQSACSSASSFSRSCLSNTPSSRSKLTSVVGGGPKQRSVRFYIVDEPGRQSKDLKMAAEISPTKAEFNKKSGVGDDKRRIAEAAREMLRSYQKKKESYDARVDDNDEDEDGGGGGGGGDDGDAASCASSDLFELDNLASIGCDQMRYREELPVYETTNLDTNRAIASGLVL
ncbi:hypothetical protein NL676_006632 [Syzygium grande]|nr:hypothetical protein NL676_006632 [Syzygium grande]